MEDIKNLKIENTLSSDQETTINFCRDGEYATVYTSDNTVLTRILKMMEKCPTGYSLKKVVQTKGSVTGVIFEIKKELVSFRKIVELSEEAREKLSKNAKERLSNKCK